MRLIFLGIAAIALAGCVNMNDTEVNTRPAAVSASDRGYIQSAIIDGLKDPGAAQLRNVRSFDLSNDQGRAICGEINGKNSFGAYIGYKPFYLRVKGERVVSIWTGDNEYSAQFAVEACSTAATGRMTVNGSA